MMLARMPCLHSNPCRICAPPASAESQALWPVRCSQSSFVAPQVEEVAAATAAAYQGLPYFWQVYMLPICSRRRGFLLLKLFSPLLLLCMPV